MTVKTLSLLCLLLLVVLTLSFVEVRRLKEHTSNMGAPEHGV